MYGDDDESIFTNLRQARAPPDMGGVRRSTTASETEAFIVENPDPSAAISHEQM